MAVLVVLIVSVFVLGRTNTPTVRNQPTTVDTQQLARDVAAIAEGYPHRTAGSEADNGLSLWLYDEFKRAGLEPHIESFPAKIDGVDVALQNIWAISSGTGEAVLVLANRDIQRPATQGANDNASGVAALLALTRTFTSTTHTRPIVFLCTTGDAAGAVGARHFMKAHSGDIAATIALRKVATRHPGVFALDGWSSGPKTAPPWLWQLIPASVSAARTKTRAQLPGIGDQLIRLAAPINSGAQAPFVAAGVPAISLRVTGDEQPRANDTVDTTSTHTLEQTCLVAAHAIAAIDGSTLPKERSGGAISLTDQRTLPGSTLMVILLALIAPLAAVTLDLFAQCKRARVRLRPALLHVAVRFAPWVLTLVVIYLCNLIGLLPKSPGALPPPDSTAALRPSYFLGLIFLLILIGSSVFMGTVERRLKKRVTIDPRALIFVAHGALVGIALVALLVSPYSILLLVPAAVLWPLAKPGEWFRSSLPIFLGLLMIAVVFVYYTLKLDLGLRAWWYLLILLESRVIPISMTLMGALLFSVTGLFATTLHTSGSTTKFSLQALLAHVGLGDGAREEAVDEANRSAAGGEAELRRGRTRSTRSTRSRGRRGPLRR